MSNIPTAVVVASKDEQLARKVQSLFLHSTLRVYISSDVIGVEVGGALKNVFAIATGFVSFCFVLFCFVLFFFSLRNQRFEFRFKMLSIVYSTFLDVIIFTILNDKVNNKLFVCTFLNNLDYI